MSFGTATTTTAKLFMLKFKWCWSAKNMTMSYYDIKHRWTYCLKTDIPYLIHFRFIILSWHVAQLEMLLAFPVGLLNIEHWCLKPLLYIPGWLTLGQQKTTRWQYYHEKLTPPPYWMWLHLEKHIKLILAEGKLSTILSVIHKRF